MSIINATNMTFEQDIKDGLVLVDFWAPWCGPCKMLAPVLDELDREMGNVVKIVKVNVEEEQQLASKYGVQSIPTMYLLKNGEVKDKVLGFKPKEALVSFINAHV